MGSLGCGRFRAAPYTHRIFFHQQETQALPPVATSQSWSSFSHFSHRGSYNLPVATGLFLPTGGFGIYLPELSNLPNYGIDGIDVHGIFTRSTVQEGRWWHGNWQRGLSLWAPALNEDHVPWSRQLNRDIVLQPSNEHPSSGIS